MQQWCQASDWRIDPDFLLRLFWNWRLRRRQQALTESCHCTQQKPTHKPLPVACPLMVYVSLLDVFSSTCLGFIGFHPLGPHFVFKLSGMMQEIIDIHHFNVIQGRCKMIHLQSQYEPFQKETYESGFPSFWFDVLRWAYDLQFTRILFILTLQGTFYSFTVLFIPICRIAQQPFTFSMLHVWANRNKPELTGNMAYLCHSSNWNRTTLIDYAGCNTIKT